MTKMPKFAACLEMMKKRDPQIAEDGFHYLRSRAAQFIDELIDAFEKEEAHSIRCWLLELIGEARSAKAFPVLCKQALSSEESLSSWGIRGLKLLDTKEARRFLYHNQLSLT